MKKNLSDKINEILRNKKLIARLKEENKENKENRGFLLGKIEYFDDLNVLIMYGITLDKEDKSKVKIFSYQLFPQSRNFNFKIGDSLPQIPEFAVYPSIREIDESVKRALDNPEHKLIDYGPFLRDL